MRSKARVAPLRKSPTENPKDIVSRRKRITSTEHVKSAEAGYVYLDSRGVDNALPSLGAQLEDLSTTHVASIFSAIVLIHAIGRWWKAMLLGPT